MRIERKIEKIPEKEDEATKDKAKSTWLCLDAIKRTKELRTKR